VQPAEHEQQQFQMGHLIDQNINLEDDPFADMVINNPELIFLYKYITYTYIYIL
jgi:hypothetical protein